LSNAIVQALEEAATKVAKAVEDAAHSVGHFFEDTGTRLRRAVTDLTEHDDRSASELDRAGRHADETPHVHGGGSGSTIPAAAGGGGPDVVAETERAAQFGTGVRTGLDAKRADPRTSRQIPDGYDPFHGQTPEEYLGAHTKDPMFTDGGHPNWNYEGEAPDHGALGPEEQTHLPVGRRIDRYGSEYGSYLSPEGTAYPNRGLPADNLAKPYHQYEVVKPLPVRRGVVKDAFGEPGLGLQFRTNGRIKWYIQHGYLREIK
jgi:hypothetical protein